MPDKANCFAIMAGNELFWPSVNKAPACIPATNEFPTATNFVKSAEPLTGVGPGSGAGASTGTIGSCLHDPTRRIVIRKIYRNLNFFISVVFFRQRLFQ